MRALLPGGLLLLALALPALGGGCMVVERRARFAGSAPTCHPSQYWDGQQCRHKGKGHGARKHDGGGPGKSGKKR